MTLLENAARAFHARSREMGGTSSQWDWGDPEYARVQAAYVDLVRTIISAIREPSDAMDDAVDRHADEVNAQFDISPRDIWHIMIDALLAGS